MEIEIENISKSFGDVQALDSVSFDVKAGELIGLIGPDGGGKTTLFRILTTLMLPDSGHAVVAGHPLTDYHAIRRSVGYMPGRFSLYPDLSVEENLNFFASIFGTTVEENYELIRDIYVQIEPFAKRRAGALSGGMKQKLALCCALVHKPAVLFLDEPTTGVDPVSRKELWAMLDRLRQDGMAILVSTAYMDEASLCDRVALIQQGKILTADTTENITATFGQPLFAIRTRNAYGVTLDIQTYPFTQSIYPFGEYLHYTGKREKADPNELQRFLRDQGHTDIALSVIKPTIEDAYMALAEKELQTTYRTMASIHSITSVQRLTKKFGTFTAVDAISFEVMKGEIFGFLGANGAGKTTAMKILIGISRPTSGTATVAGYDIYKETEQIKKSIGYMSQRFSLYNDLTIRENIEFFGGIYGLTQHQIRDKGE